IDVGILSNGNDNMLRPLIDNSELSEDINTVMSVNEIKQYKPSPASYALILKYNHLKREEILFENQCITCRAWFILLNFINRSEEHTYEFQSRIDIVC